MPKDVSKKQHKARFAGSGGVNVRHSQGFARRVVNTTQSLSQSLRRAREVQKKYQAELASLTFAQRDAVDKMMVDDVDQDEWEDEAPPVLPLGEEGMFLSAVGVLLSFSSVY
ncbi:hypothetical protein FOMPIDRAFT_1054560 [Fomitopsis schrenkii]|uniref:Uncharacterized protein n=1 Tax=Fomitopsis schrenkii TaxID=2126942 RepID=S8DNQ8_FOMSC|nr:hypothetical protein FOMPIDRAFT_1054560 [Fomitopsis schrenkii]